MRRDVGFYSRTHPLDWRGGVHIHARILRDMVVVVGVCVISKGGVARCAVLLPHCSKLLRGVHAEA